MLIGGDHVAAFRQQVEDWIALYAGKAPTMQLAKLYALSSTAHAAANIRAENIGQIPLSVVDKDGTPQPDHPVSRLLSDRHAVGNLQLRTELTLCFWGHSLTWVKRRPDGAVLELRWINPTTYQTEVDPVAGLLGFVVQSVPGQKEQLIRPQNAIYPYGVDFEDDYDGVAPAEACFSYAAVDPEIGETLLSFMRNRAVPLSLVQPAEVKSPTGQNSPPDNLLIRRMLNFFKGVQGSKNAGRTIVAKRRWEVLELQQKFNEFDLSSFQDSVERDVSKAFRVPLSLITASDEGYAAAYQKDESWVQNWLIPRAFWIAGFYSKTLLTDGERLAGFKVAPDITKLTRRDETAVTNVTNARVSSAYMTLHQAQIAAGFPNPDRRLKDIYLVNGIPTHISVLVSQAHADPIPGEETVGEGAPDGDGSTAEPMGVLPPRPPSPMMTAFVPERAYREMRACTTLNRRKAAQGGVDFDAQHIPSHVTTAIRVLVQAGATDDVVLSEARAMYMRHEERVIAMRTFAAVASTYLDSLFGLINAAFRNRVDRKTFGDLGRAEISTAFWQAYRQGLADAGLDPNETIEAEREFVHMQALAERRHWTRLANEIYRKVLPRVEGDSVLRETQHMIFLTRMEMWVAKGLRAMYNQGVMNGRADPMLRWDLGATKEHCQTCKGANGQIHRASIWARHDLEPGKDNLICGGFRCDCEFVPVPGERAQGRVDRIPKAHRSEIVEEVPA